MPAKKSRPTVIELNGNRAQIWLRLLVIMMPAWLNMFLLVFSFPMLARWFTVPTIVFVFCASFTLFLWDRKLRFKNQSLVFPSLLNREIKYSAIKSLSAKSRHGIYSLVFEISGKSKLASHEIPLDGLTSRFAEQLWTQISTKLRGTVVEPTVRDWLKDLAEGNSLKARSQTQLKAQIKAPALSANVPTGAAIDRRLTPPELSKSTETSMEIDLNSHSWFGELYAYVASYDKSFYRTFATFWLIAAIFQLFLAGLRLIPFYQYVQFFGGANWKSISLDDVFYSIDYWWRVFGVPIGTAINFLCDNIFAAAAFVLLSCTGLIYTIINWNTPDTVLLNDAGVTEQINTPNGAIAKRHLPWSNIESIEIVQARRPFRLVAEPTLLFTALEAKKDTVKSIKIPMSTIATAHKGSILLNIIGSYAPQVTVPQLLTEQLSRESTTYTDIWLNSFQSAPQLSNLTPLSTGELLEAHNLMIVEQIGSGGQAVTYLARQNDSADSPLVVLKEIILPVYVESAKQRATARFNRDAQLLKELEHPGIVRLFDYFVDRNRAFLMLEYIEGTTLRDKVVDGVPLPEQTVINLAHQMTDILNYLHTRTPAVMHRDFTPENLLLNQAGQLKLIDFDVAFRSDESGNKATVVGKQNFLPPEQFRGHPCPQSDIYALGATLQYLLTGEEPLALARSQPREKNQLCSEELDKFVAKCTELELPNRFSSAAELKNALPAIEAEIHA